MIERLNKGDPETHRAWPFERRVEVVKAVLRALAAAHAQGILHRDVKPANVMVAAMGRFFLPTGESLAVWGNRKNWRWSCRLGGGWEDPRGPGP